MVSKMAENDDVNHVLHMMNMTGGVPTGVTLCGEHVWERPGDGGDELPLWVDISIHRYLLADYEDLVCEECMRRVQRAISRAAR
jgi:hypothetical protein